MVEETSSTSDERPIVFRRRSVFLAAPANALGDEASSSCRKRQRLEHEEEGAITTKLPRNLLECPVCFLALTIPTFQCDNGHIACSSCCTKLNNICPTCKVPTGKIRCRYAESVVEASIVPCPNAKHGCTEKFSYGKELAHEKECGFVLCYCPAPNCNYTGKYKDLYSHYYVKHWKIGDNFDCGIPYSTILKNGMKDEVIQEYSDGLDDGPLVVVQGFKVQQGMHVTVNCIAPCAPEVGKFTYQISYSSGHHNNEFGPVEMNRIQKVSLQTPEIGSCMFVPDYFLSVGYRFLEMVICICRVEEAVEEAEEGVDSEDEHDD